MKTEILEGQSFKPGDVVTLNGFGSADGEYKIDPPLRLDKDATYTLTADFNNDTIKLERNKISMKEKLLVTLAVVAAVGGAGYAAVHHHNQTVYHQMQAEAVAEQKAIAQAKAEAAAKAAAAKLAAEQAAQAAAAKAATKTSTVRTVVR